MPTGKRQPLDTTLELSVTETAALRYIVEYQKTDRFKRAPSHRELIEHLNSVLPRRSHGGPAITSTVQTYRIASKLRLRGYLQPIQPDDANTARNMVATSTGESFVRKIAAKGAVHH